VATDATDSAQNGTGEGQGSLDTSQISNATLTRLENQPGANLDTILDGIRDVNARKSQQ
jgi:hypothetical protein